ncbi:alanine racemase [Nocardioides sp. WS12]|uniref:alanine racemase n=1 Tax=Nocardioides sp. WS12 TaxID=2486272 RepID=UPI0015F88C78|nr:alanine racemase [Nocardioides sp. WS12]
MSTAVDTFALDHGRPTSGVGYPALESATAHLEPPFAVIDVDALQANAQAMVRRAAGKPIRLATKSVRCRAITRAVLQTEGYAGILALTLAEALWLAEDCDDVVVGYPTTDATALRTLAGSPELAARVTIMVDSTDQLDLVENAIGSVVGPGNHRIRVCIDLDASLRLLGGRVHLGARRSPVHTPEAAAALARDVVRRPRFQLVGLMAYEGQTAGVGDNAPGSPLGRLQIRAMQRVSVSELAARRAEAVAAVQAVAPLEFVNGGGTGSIEQTVAEAAVTEVAAGSGLYAPVLFDRYRSFQPHPAAFHVQSVVRRPASDMATVLGGGWVASGAAGRDRLPTPSWPTGLELTATEGAGEAQTPLRGPGAADLSVGDRVWFRHAKAGELCERVDVLHLVRGDAVVATVPTYRGEGMAFL